MENTNQKSWKDVTEYVWFFKNKKGIVFAETLYDAKKKICSEQKIRRSQQGLLSIMTKDSFEKNHFMYN